ncbi:MAG: helix-turn-helix transcriptional regulator [Bacteroidia bacterium]|nr:helix-turn-helix transcriptional regulator [Bacteroidia bacterium]
MAIHIGEIIKNLVKKKGISVTDFADKINYSRRNVYEIFDKKSIDTELLVKIGKILEQNLFLNYISEKDISELINNKKTSADELINIIERLKKTVDNLETRIISSPKSIKKSSKK